MSPPSCASPPFSFMASVRTVFLITILTGSAHPVKGLLSLQARADVATTEISKDTKAISGNTSALTEEGYQEVASLKSGDDMKDYVRRILAVDGRTVLDESFLSGIVLYYDGVNAVQSLQALENELEAAAWVNQGVGRTVPLSEEGYQKVADLHDKMQMKAFARRILASLDSGRTLDNDRLMQIIRYFDGEVFVQDFDTLQQELKSNIELNGPSGSTALLSEDGYREVVAMKNESEMKLFVRRLLHTEGRAVKSEKKDREALAGFVPFYSGTKATQDVAAMLKELRGASWVDHGLGRSAPLSEEGYQSVAALQSDIQMKAFAERVLAQNSNSSMDDERLNRLVPYYSGRYSVQDFDSFREELFTDDVPNSDVL